VWHGKVLIDFLRNLPPFSIQNMEVAAGTAASVVVEVQ
jgi:hypothetical protein